jgi:hypothetical protein
LRQKYLEIKVRHSPSLIIFSLANLFLPVLGKIMFAKLRNSLTYNKYIKDPTTLATKSTGRKEGGGFPFQKKSSWDLVDYEQQPQLVLKTLFFCPLKKHCQKRMFKM